MSGNRKKLTFKQIKQKEWYQKNRERILKDRKKYQDNNKEKLKKKRRESYLKNKKIIIVKNIKWAKNNPEKVKEIAKRCYDKRKKETPWVFFTYKAKNRCDKRELYIELGIEYKLTMKEIKKLWFRDEAYLLRIASLDRINPDGNYEYSNCRFIEKDINALLSRIKNNKETGRFESTIKGRKNG